MLVISTIAALNMWCINHESNLKYIENHLQTTKNLNAQPKNTKELKVRVHLQTTKSHKNLAMLPHDCFCS